MVISVKSFDINWSESIYLCVSVLQWRNSFDSYSTFMVNTIWPGYLVLGIQYSFFKTFNSSGFV